MARYRRAVFTVNNPTDSDIRDVSNTTGWSYLIWAIEFGEENGTPHVQGYGERSVQTYLTCLRAWSPRAHFASARGSAGDNLTYITKDGPLEFCHGEPRVQGLRNDLDEARELAASDGMRAVVAASNLQAIRVAEKWLSYCEKGRDWEPEVHWYWGPTGTGKSRAAQSLAPNAYWKDPTKWWDGYDGHDDIIIDEFRGSWWPLNYLLRLLDRYPFRVECKGGSRQILARRIIITSCWPPERAYTTSGEALDQLTRRITFCTHLTTQKSGVIVDIPSSDRRPYEPPLDLDDILDGLGA